MDIYVASSWRNQLQPEVVKALRDAGHTVYDFRNPRSGYFGFSWAEIDPAWQSWSVTEFIEGLRHPIADEGFHRDMHGLANCDACVLVLPCGRSAHLEAGYAVGAGKPLVVLLADGEPELMYRMANCLCTSIEEVVAWLDCLELAKVVMRYPRWFMGVGYGRE